MRVYTEADIRSLRQLLPPSGCVSDERIMSVFESLHPREAQILRWISEDKKTHKEIGDMLGIGAARVGQIKRRACRLLRSDLGLRGSFPWEVN